MSILPVTPPDKVVAILVRTMFLPGYLIHMMEQWLWGPLLIAFAMSEIATPLLSGKGIEEDTKNHIKDQQETKTDMYL